MTINEFAVGLGYLGSALGVAMVVPQIVRIVRHPSLPGVSPLSWALTSMACLGWMTYGFRMGATPQIPGNVLLVSGALAVVLLVNGTIPRGRRALLLASAAAALLAIVWLIPADSVGYFAFTVGLFASWPQLYDSIGNWRARLNSGVSVSTWNLRIASQVCWLTYAVGTSDLAVGISACVALSTAAAMVALELMARAASPATAVAAEAA